MQNQNGRILHILIGGQSGGIESLCKSIYDNTDNHYFCFIKRIGNIYFQMCDDSKRVFSIFENKKLYFWDCLYATKKIRYFCQINCISKIVIHHGNIFDWLLSRFLKSKKVKVILYVHSNLNDLIGKRTHSLAFFVRKMEFIKAAKKADKIFAISNSVKKSILINCPSLEESHIFVNYNGIDLKRFSPKKKNIGSNNVIRIAYVGRLTKEKGIQKTINILSHIHDFEFNFDIIGEGPYLSTLKEIVNEKGLNNRVTFSGYSSNVETVLKSKDIFIHFPIWEEGFGIAVLEALAMGLVCIVNNKGAMCEIITNNINGFIIDEEHSPEKQIEAIFSSFLRGECFAISNLARESSLKFSIEKTITNIENEE